MLPVLLFALLAFQSDDLALKSQQARELMGAGRFAEAVPIYQSLVRALPGNPGLRLNLGMALHMAGQDRQAAPQLEVALKLQPTLFPAALFLGAAYRRLGEAARSVLPLQKAVRLDPKHAEAREMLAESLLQTERFAEAASHFEKLSPEKPRIVFGLVRSYEALAQREFQKLPPDSAYELSLLGAARLKQRQFSSAFYFYRQALARDPNLKGAHAALAEIYRETGRPDWAAVEEERERQISSKFKVQSSKLAERYYLNALAYNQRAGEAFSRLTQLPPSGELHGLLAEVHRSQRRHVEAVKEWREALKFSPDDPRLRRELALSLHDSRDHEGAREVLERLIQEDPEAADLNYMMGDTLLNLQNAENAMPFLQRAAAQAPKLLPAHAALARAYLQAGQGGKAIPHLKAALPIDRDGSLHFQLARAYQAAGQEELARAAMARYQEIRKASEAEREALEKEVQITPP